MPKLAKSGKKREIRLETASCGDERAIFVRKKSKTAKTGEKKGKKKKNEKKLKNFKKGRKNS